MTGTAPSEPFTPDPSHIDARSPIFVVGYGHSGTTLLAKLLGKQPGVARFVSESKFFERIEDWRELDRSLTTSLERSRLVGCFLDCIDGTFPTRTKPTLGDQVPGNRARLLADANAGRPVEDLFAATADDWAQACGADRFLEKTPAHVFHVDEIMAAIPRAQIVEIVREPLDVLASKKTRSLRARSGVYGDDTSWKHLTLTYDPFWDTISWRAAIRAGRAGSETYPESWSLVRYEELVQDPVATIEALSERLHIEFDPGEVRTSSNNSADESLERSSGNGSLQGTGVDAQSVGRWRGTLDPVEAKLVVFMTRHDAPHARSEVARPGIRDIPRGLRIAGTAALEPARRIAMRVQTRGPRATLRISRRWTDRLLDRTSSPGARNA